MSATPLIRQYLEIKQQYAETLVLFQVGDFYEIFFDDARIASAFLGIALTQRGMYKGEPIPLCGVPIHAVNHHLVKLVKGGFRIAICDQLTTPQPGKNLVDRGVTQVLTPGTLTDSSLLNDKDVAYCAAVCQLDGRYGIVAAELLTGHFFVTSVPVDQEALLFAELQRFLPAEVIVFFDKKGEQLAAKIQSHGYVVSRHADITDNNVLEQWLAGSAVAGLIARSPAAQQAVALVHSYFAKNQPESVDQEKQIAFYTADDYLLIDESSQRNLEITKNVREGTRTHTLLSVLDRAVTSMGSRTIKKWLTRPLVDRVRIEQRHKAVAYYVQHHAVREALHACLRDIGDLERIVGRIALGRAQFADYQMLARALGALPAVSKWAACEQVQLLVRLCAMLEPLEDVRFMLERALNDDPHQDMRIKPGYDQELDRLRGTMQHSSQRLLEFERQEQMRTGIQSLKIRYNSVHGYSIEVTKTNVHLVPDTYIRTQTLANRERFTTPELQELERVLTRGNALIAEREDAIYADICQQVAQHVSPLKRIAYACAQIDALLGFAEAAYQEQYVCPTMHDSRDICITKGRHPVVAAQRGYEFIPNDTALCDDESLWIITGPNMGGKSTYLRQVALICLMAQAGAWVPAEAASLSVIDRIFTRIGAADNVAAGKSTFWVEMEETALICTQATRRSLVILDEVGRGTSTYDGLSIAWAVVEYLYTTLGVRCLFATHYHELSALADQHHGIVSYHAASKQTDNGIVLLHTIMRGSADSSFGLEVASSAGLPASIVDHARMLLQQLHVNQSSEKSATKNYQPAAQIDSADNVDYKRIKKLLDTIDPDNISPRQALDIIWQLKES